MKLKFHCDVGVGVAAVEKATIVDPRYRIRRCLNEGLKTRLSNWQYYSDCQFGRRPAGREEQQREDQSK